MSLELNWLQVKKKNQNLMVYRREYKIGN